MSEKTNVPEWVKDLKAAAEAWYNANPDTRSILVIAAGEADNGDLTVNASIIGNGRILAMATTAAMNDNSEDNDPGRILRVAAMKHLMSNAKEIGTIEINVGDKDKQDTETENTDNYE